MSELRVASAAVEEVEELFGRVRLAAAVAAARALAERLAREPEQVLEPLGRAVAEAGSAGARRAGDAPGGEGDPGAGVPGSPEPEPGEPPARRRSEDPSGIRPPESCVEMFGSQSSRSAEPSGQTELS